MMFSLEKAPQFGQQNPQIYADAFKIQASEPEVESTLLSPLKIIHDSIAYVNETLPTYRAKGSNLKRAIKEGTANCAARTVLLHNLVVPFDHISAGVALIYSEEFGTGHWLNTFTARQNELDLTIDSYMIRTGVDEHGKETYDSRLRTAHGQEHFDESCFGGITNLLELLEQRRKNPDAVSDEEWVFMLNKTTDRFLTTVAKTTFDSQTTNEHDEDKDERYRTTATVYFDEMATAVCDAFTGDETVLADEDLREEITDISNGNLIPAKIDISESYDNVPEQV